MSEEKISTDLSGRPYVRYVPSVLLVRKCKKIYDQSQGSLLWRWMSGFYIYPEEARQLIQESVDDGLAGMSAFLWKERGVPLKADIAIDDDLKLHFLAMIGTRLGLINERDGLNLALDIIAALVLSLEAAQLKFDGGTAYAEGGVLHIILEKMVTLAEIRAHPEDWGEEKPMSL